MSATGGFTLPGAIVQSHTQGEARTGDGERDEECVVFVGERQIGECYADGEVQTEEDQANAARVVKTWNAYQKLVAVLRRCALPTSDVDDHREEQAEAAAALLRELGESS